MKRFLLSLIAIVALAGLVQAQQRPTFKSLVGDVTVGDVAKTGPLQTPYITWGGDLPVFMANGGLVTKPGSTYAQSGLNLKLVNGDNFVQQVRDYMSGKSWMVRCTYEMGGMASEVMNSDPRTKPVMLWQLTWSMGDHVIFREPETNLRQASAGVYEVVRPTQLQQWKVSPTGRTKKVKICLQSEGPHVGLLDDTLKSGGLTWDDVEVVWVKDLTGPDGPAEKFRKDPTIDACCVITPDMIGLTSGIDSVGNGAEGTVKGARVGNSTVSMDKSIADVFICRSDFFTGRRAEVDKFVIGYAKSTENLMKLKATYADGRGQSPEYIAALKMAQSIFGNTVLPTIEEDAHGLISDANFARIPGNELFFNDPNNLVGFASKQTSALDLATKLGYVRSKVGFTKADWDYKKLSEQVGVNYVPPVYASGRVKAEVADFSEDLDLKTVFTFEIRFDPEQETFPVETYFDSFKQYCENAAKHSRAGIRIEGHSDPTLALQHFFWAAKAKGLITGDAPNYKFKGQALDLANTAAIIQAIQTENLSGQKRKDRDGNIVEVPDPKDTVAAALKLSQERANEVKKQIEKFAVDNNFQIDMAQSLSQGIGIAQPVNARPRDLRQAKENMRVVFRVVRVKAEAVSAEDFNFDQ